MKVVYFAPKGFDYSSNQITEGLHLISKLGEAQFFCTNKVVHHGAKIDDLEIVDEEFAWDIAGDVDMILVSSGGDMSFTQGYAGRCFKDPELKKKLVFLDGHDSNQYLVNPDDVVLYLKRELRYPEANCIIWNNVRSFLFGVYDFHFDEVQPGYDERDVDVSFVAFGGSNQLRAHAAEQLRKYSEKNKIKAFVSVDQNGQPLQINEYRAMMRNSKVIVSIPGAGLDTLRFWEAMGFGAVLCSADITRMMVVRDAPEPHRHALYFDTWERMLELTRLVVNDPVRWRKMRAASDQLIRCSHSTIRRAWQLFELFWELA